MPLTTNIRKASAIALASMTISLAAGSASADVGGSSDPVPGAGNSWVIMADTSLKATLEGWTKAAGWTLIWDSPVDYRMRASASFSGGFDESASRLIDSIYNGNPDLLATFHRGNRVLHIQNQALSSN